MRLSARLPSWSVVLTAGAVSALAGTVGSDSRWLAALGAVILRRHDIPRGVPYASADSSRWHNALALAELVFRAVYAAGSDHALLVLQVAAVLTAFALLALGTRRDGAGETPTVLALLLVLAGSLPAVTVVRLQLFSLVLFPALLLLIRADRRRRSPRIWLLLPLLALWANLHGGVLVGLAVAELYLLLDRMRRRPLTTLALVAGCLAATAATPALLDTPAYFHSLIANEAAREGIGLWAPPSPHVPTDMLTLAAAAGLLALAVRSRPPAWELAAAVLLTASTLHAVRGGVWLLFLLAAPAAHGLRLGRLARPVYAGLAAVGIASIAYGLAAAPSLRSDPHLARVAVRAAAGTPILADATLAEEVAVAGGRVWVADPLDAFPRRDQRLWLSWAEGRPSGDAARSLARVIVVTAGEPASRRAAADPRFRMLARDTWAIVYVRRSLPSESPD